MTRPLRIEYDGAWYHVMNRGWKRCRTFLQDQDYTQFIKLLKEITQIFSIQVHAFSLMPNHYHLMIHTPKAGLARAMRHLNGIYTQRFNKVHRRDGPLFRGRYKAVLVDTEEYMTALIRYIHLNPVKARICLKPTDHQWSSHRNYLKEIKGYEWLCTKEILAKYGKDLKTARNRFDVIVRSNLSEEVVKEIENPSNGILGGDFFKRWVHDNFVEPVKIKDKEIPQLEKQIRPPIKARELIEKIGFCYDMNFSEIKQTKTGQKNEARSLLIYLMRHRLGYKLKLIAKWLDTKNEYAIARALSVFKKEMTTNKSLLKRIREIEKVVLK